MKKTLSREVLKLNSLNSHEQQLNDCLEFFGENRIWKVILEGFCSKYRSYGRFSGTVVVRNLSPGDIDELEGFFAENFHGRKSASVSAEKFIRALSRSRFGDVRPEEVLEKFFGSHLMGKADMKALREKKISTIENDFSEAFSGTDAASLLNGFEDIVRNIFKISIYNCGEEELDEWKNLLWMSGRIYNSLPYRSDTRCYLPVFAAEITGNPHAFDTGTGNGNLLYRVIQMDLMQRKIDVEAKEDFPAYKRQKSYLLAGIMIDDISNYAVLYNVRGIKKNGEAHRGMEGFCRERDIVQIPLNVLSELDRIECVNNELFVAENPAVFAALSRDASCMCMNGQPRLAGLMLLELAEKSETKVFYSGDFDPEGLLIAQKLSGFYKGKFSFLHMSEEDYMMSMSDEELSERRLKMLEKITDPEIAATARRIKEHRKAGYQENIITEFSPAREKRLQLQTEAGE